jgi:Domain of Unknown Function with PDB structure (DUF3857)/Transglutaminase-like superfamily
MGHFCQSRSILLSTLTLCLLFALAIAGALAQEAQPKPPTKPPTQDAEKTEQSEKPAHPAQIELLETKVRFATNGDSRKEVHAVVRINSELGVRQFAQLNFDFNRSFESIEIPLVHITHTNGGTSDILPGAITDHPNPAVVSAAAYQDVRVKFVRILGLQPGDRLEYRVIRTVSHHPLAPDFWLEHSFDRTGVVSHEIFEVDLPTSRQVQTRVNPKASAESEEKSGEGDSARTIYRWSEHQVGSSAPSASSDDSDVVLTTYQQWSALGNPLGKLLEPSPEDTKSVSAKAQEIVHTAHNDEKKLQALYDFVAEKISTVDVPLGSTGFRARSPAEILASGYANPEDKFTLLSALASTLGMESRAALFGATPRISRQVPTPSRLMSCAILVHLPSPPDNLGHGQSKTCDHCGQDYWLFPSMEVAPFSVLPATLRGKQAFVPHYRFDISPFVEAPKELPFLSTQSVRIDAALAEDGKLTAKARYSMRGENELLLRATFHKTPKEKWKEVGQILSLTDGFRGQVTGLTASDPFATKEPFTFEYQLDQPKFVDWSKKTVRLPVLLPQLGLPDPPAKPPSGSATVPIELGTPLEVDTQLTLRLPPGSAATAPVGTSVERDYATYSSQYSVNGSTITASRHVKFILRQVPADRAADYNAFLHAVQSDEAQDFTIEQPNAVPKTNSAAPNATASPKTVPPGS